ncbi:MAG: WbqC family protein [Bacteroidota bacterium]
MFSTAIIKTEYLPPVSTFWALANSDKVLLEVKENYQKKSTRNRARIQGVNKIEVLSVPLKRGKNSKMPIENVQVSYDDNWPGKHLHSIRSAYGNSPYFDFYFESIETIIRTEYDTLLELNNTLLNLFLESLTLSTDIQNTTAFKSEYEINDCDLRFVKYNDPILPNYTPKKYNQVFEEKHGFVPNLSILDLIMCKGPESILYI